MPIEVATLMLDLFRGRPDVVAVSFFDSQKGKPAFRPKPLPRPMEPKWLDERHLAGRQCLGFYLIEPPDSVYCSAMDFDNHPDHPNPAWKDQAEAMASWLSQAGFEPLVEQSQSGSGAHAWLFFDRPCPAWLARAWWAAAARAVGMSHLEAYPRQDAVGDADDGTKGLGNLIRYPLWNQSSFVSIDEGWVRVEPCAALTGARRIDPNDLKEAAPKLGLGELTPVPTLANLPAVRAVTDAAASLLEPVLGDYVRKLVAREHTLLGRRWRGDTKDMRGSDGKAPDTTRTGVAMSLAAEMVRSFVPPVEAMCALLYWCDENGIGERARGQGWLQATFAKAYAYARQRVETTLDAPKGAAVLAARDAAGLHLQRVLCHDIKYVTSGIRELDESIDGAEFGDMVVLAARPSHCKSSIGIAWVLHAAQEYPGLIVSEEMKAERVGKRMLQMISAYDSEFWPSHADEVGREADAFLGARKDVYVAHGAGTIDGVEELIDRYCQERGVRVVCVDYLQLIRSVDRRSEYDRVTEVSKRINALAKRNSCVMLALCQAGREADKRSGFDLQYSDIRNSGQIEQDADIILGLCWPHKIDPDEDRQRFVITALKNRNGEIRAKKIETRFDARTQRFADDVFPEESETSRGGDYEQTRFE